MRNIAHINQYFEDSPNSQIIEEQKTVLVYEIDLNEVDNSYHSCVQNMLRHPDIM